MHTQAVQQRNFLNKNTNAYSRGKIIILGDEKLSRIVERSLQRLPYEKATLTETRNLLSEVNSRAAGIVLVDPSEQDFVSVATLKKDPATKQIPVYVVYFNSISDQLARRLYKDGAELVAVFPEDDFLFADLITETKRNRNLLGFVKRKNRFFEALRSRARVFLDKIKGINVRLNKGRVLIIGKLASPQKNRELKDFVLRTPGVEEVSQVSTLKNFKARLHLVRPKS